MLGEELMQKYFNFNLSGDIYEFGIGKIYPIFSKKRRKNIQSLRRIKQFLMKHNKKYNIYGFDSFEGLPKNNENLKRFNEKRFTNIDKDSKLSIKTKFLIKLNLLKI